MKLIVILMFLFPLSTVADQYSDLKKYAREVPIAEIDREVVEYIKNETNESTAGIKSNYTLALFENQKTGKTWHILDGYYEVGRKILFLDFTYKPTTKTWWPIENYRYYIPASVERFLLQANELCNPFKRNFLGLVRVSSTSINQVKAVLRTHFRQQPLIMINPGDILIADLTRDGFLGDDPKPLFTLNERSLVTALENKNIRANLISSGRDPSSSEIKQTYEPVKESCSNQ